MRTSPIVPLPRPDVLTDDSAAILRFAVDAVKAGVRTALVTLVEIRGGAARPLGAHMAVREDGTYCGFVSGGCTEAAVATEALEVIAAGHDRDVRYGQGSPYFDIVLPCGGGVTLNIHHLRTVAPLQAVLASLEERAPAGLRYDSHQQRLEFVPHETGIGWDGAFFSVGYRPRARLFIFGRSIELDATVRLAQASGYEVHASETCDHTLASMITDADAAVVLLYHDLDQELPALRAALAAAPFYIGALGSQRTHQRRIETLLRLGYSEHDGARIKAPIGLFKARSSHALALSVLADVAAARGGV